MAVQDVAKNSWNCFRNNFIGLFRATAPYIALSISLTLISPTLVSGENIGITLVLFVLEGVAWACISLFGLKFLYTLDGIEIDVSGKKIVYFLISVLYIGIAFGIGLMFFVVPGIIVLVATFLVPVFILKDSQGPIESVASSVALIKDELLAVTLFLGAFFLAIYGTLFFGLYALDFLSLPEPVIESAAQGCSLLIGLYTLPIMKHLYSDLANVVPSNPLFNNAMKKTTVQGFEVSGISVRTNNSREMETSNAKIGWLWETFYKELAPELAEGAQIIGLYTNYESDQNGDYDIAACTDSQIPPDLYNVTSLKIDSGDYLVFEAQGEMPHIVSTLWQDIWAYFNGAKCPHKRAYTTDFELYKSDSTIEIYVAVQ